MGESLVQSRLETLRFPPHFHGALACSALGDLTALWRRLSEPERGELAEFEREYSRAVHLDLRGVRPLAAEMLRSLAETHPHFQALAQERLQMLERSETDQEARDE